VAAFQGMVLGGLLVQGAMGSGSGLGLGKIPGGQYLNLGG
jgi:hypothetical protein